jgi:hypothetical protein
VIKKRRIHNLDHFAWIINEMFECNLVKSIKFGQIRIFIYLFIFYFFARLWFIVDGDSLENYGT